jgi:hypothetical protein
MRRCRVILALATAGIAARAAAPAAGARSAGTDGRPRFELMLAKLERPDERGAPVTLDVVSTAEDLASADGDSRFATLRISSGRVSVRIAADAPAEPDLVSPVLASAVFAARHPGSARQPALLAGYGAWRAGRFWGKSPAAWGALLAAAGVTPSAAEICASSVPAGDELLDTAAAASAISVAMAGSDAAGFEAHLASGSVEPTRIQTDLELAASAPRADPPRRALPDRFLRGVSYAMSNSPHRSYLSRRSAQTLGRLSEERIGAVSVMPYCFQAQASDPRIHLVGHRPFGETPEATLRAIEDAHARGMAVLVKPHIWLRRGFTGTIAMASDASWREWFCRYREYLVVYAVVAEAGKAEMFDVGVELIAAEKRAGEWRQAIAAVRAATGAPLLYSSNWAGGAASVPFWDALDAVGVDLYDPLSTAAAVKDETLAAGAIRVLTLAERAARAAGKPLYLTEVGYPSAAAAWLAPNEEDVPRQAFDQDAARCARAILQSLPKAAPSCRGFFWWKVCSDGRPRGPGEKSFNILGGPIEKLLKEFAS